MAQRVNVELVDDIDGSEAKETVNFGIDGADYEIDLSEKNAAALRDALAQYVGQARKLSGRNRRRPTSKSNGGASPRNGEASASDVRVWARANGLDVPDRGRVSAEVREAYAAAH